MNREYPINGANPSSGTTYFQTANQVVTAFLTNAGQSKDRSATNLAMGVIICFPVRKRSLRKSPTSASPKPGTMYLQTANQIPKFLTNAGQSQNRSATKLVICVICPPFRKRSLKSPTSASPKPGTTYLQIARQIPKLLGSATRSRDWSAEITLTNAAEPPSPPSPSL